MSHTREPWPPYSEVATQMHPILDHSCVLMEFHDYARARACVNACAGIDTEALENTKSLNEYYNQIIRERDVSGSKVILAEQQRDDLQALCRELEAAMIKAFNNSHNEARVKAILDEAINKARGML